MFAYPKPCIRASYEVRERCTESMAEDGQFGNRCCFGWTAAEVSYWLFDTAELFSCVAAAAGVLVVDVQAFWFDCPPDGSRRQDITRAC